MEKHEIKITNGVCNMNITTQQESTNFFCKEPEDKYLKLCWPTGKMENHWLQESKQEKKSQFFTNRPPNNYEYNFMFINEKNEIYGGGE